MSYVNIPNDYDAKLKRVNDAMNLKVPDRVPLYTQSISWGYSYTQTKINDVYKDREKLVEASIGFCKDIYCDVIHLASIDAPLGIIDILKPEKPQYIVSSDGYSLQHIESAEMRDDEYDKLINDPKSFIINELLPRRYPMLREKYPSNYEALQKCYDEIMYYIGNLGLGRIIAKEKYGVPVMASGVCYNPLDMLFDFFRGFKGIVGDFRRRPEKVADACQSLLQYIVDIQLSNVKSGDTIFTPLHMATYMNPKQFEKLYWPSLKGTCDEIISRGGKPLLYLENDWTPYVDYLLSLPKNSIAVMVEYGDLKLFKKKFDGHIAMVGGMPCEKLRYNTKEECIDYAKATIDALAPNGGYLFSTDKLLLSPNDINPENYKAVIETVKEYGKY